MSGDALGGVHLVPADEVFRQGYPTSTRLSVCGESVTTAPDGDEVDPGYCGDCVSAVIQRGQGMDDPCPHCGRTSDVKVITGTSSKVQAWSCSACGTEWAVTVVNPHSRSLLDQLAEGVAARAVLREVIALRELAPTLTDGELRARLIGCLARLAQVCRHG